MDDFRYVEQFHVDNPEDWFRVMPTGRFSRFGRSVEVTYDKINDMAGHFGHVPETGVPVTKEHHDPGGKVGDVAAVQAHGDGLYARIAWKDTGRRALDEGAFQYFSPEIIWGPTDYEGREIKNCMIGLTLTNTPFFGKTTALYSLKDIEQGEDYRTFTQEQRRQLASEGKALPDGSFPIVTAQDLKNAMQAVGRGSANPKASILRHIRKRARALIREGKLSADQWRQMTESSENFRVKEFYEMEDKQTLIEAFTTAIKEALGKGEGDGPSVEEFNAIKQELEAKDAELKKAEAEKEAARKEAEQAARVEEFSAKFEAWDNPPELPAMLAAIAGTYPEQADKLAEQFNALVAQIKAGNLFGELGSAGGADEVASPSAKFMALAQQKVDEGKAGSLAEAFAIIAAEEPDLYKAHRKAAATHPEKN